MKNKAINIHMGVSPYYRGNSCNFWAMYDGNPQLVGATIHMLSKGLDSGDMLFHAFPKLEAIDPFILGMNAVKSAHKSLVTYISNGLIEKFVAVKQNRELEIRYTRNVDFNDEIAKKYLENLPDLTNLKGKIENRDSHQFLNPFIL
ncbi:hypothetical protein J7E78_00305 [Paenibacillus polymyxa]|uniref:formyltransferase family protein n=1 Tax=Paenibacillus polymyxa TaxID=1406 RepID=UPI001BE93C39|nr:formyltransferase family protein [Paenibacillus polymyxa]MBT2282001.1 hypothetical protein [Paenibacillus polymyxa]